MSNLYQIDAAIENAIERLFDTVNEDGEVEEGTAAELEELKAERAQKLDNIGAYIKNIEADVDAIKAEIKTLQDRAKVKQNKIDRLEDYVAKSLKANNESKFESARVVFSFRKSVSVDITNADMLPKKYIVKKTETAPDKTAIKEALKAGKVVKGAQLVEKQNLQIK